MNGFPYVCLRCQPNPWFVGRFFGWKRLHSSQFPGLHYFVVWPALETRRSVILDNWFYTNMTGQQVNTTTPLPRSRPRPRAETVRPRAFVASLAPFGGQTLQQPRRQTQELRLDLPGRGGTRQDRVGSAGWNRGHEASVFLSCYKQGSPIGWPKRARKAQAHDGACGGH